MLPPLLALLLTQAVEAPRAYRVEVHGPIDESVQSHVHRAIELARAHGALLVLEIDTPGGGVEVTWQIAREIQRAGDDGLVSVAWVNERATSAGAMLSMACSKLYMTPTATIGSALPVRIGPTGMQPTSEDASVREKELSYCREEFRVIAEKSGHEGLIAEAMVDPDIGVVLLERDGARVLVSWHEYDELRLVGEEQPRYVRTVSERGKLLNVGGDEALDLGLCDGIVASLEDLERHLALGSGEMQLLERTRSEDAASLLALLTPLLLIAAFVLAYVEFKIPGFGIAGILSIACFALVVFGRWLVGLADVPHVVLLVGGALLVATELFVAPGTIWFGVAGAVLFLVGIVWSFAGAQTGFEYGLDQRILVDETLRLLIAGVVAMGATWALSRFLPRTPVFGRLVLDPNADGAGGARAAAMPETRGAHAEHARVGALGTALTALRPVGKVALSGGETLEFEALADGPEIARGSAVRVVSVQRSGRLVVAPATGEESA